MAIPIKVPRLGWTMEEGVFVEWLKPEGATIAPGDQLYVLEGEKAAQEIESIDGGTLRLPPDAPKPGQTLPVGAVLGYEFGLAFFAQETGGDGHGAAGIEDVDHGLAVVRRDFDGGMTAAGGCSADE